MVFALNAHPGFYTSLMTSYRWFCWMRDPAQGFGVLSKSQLGTAHE
jgi:hypothetical protein